MEGLLELAQKNEPILLTLVIIGSLVQIIYLILKQSGFIKSTKLSENDEFKKIIKAMTEELKTSNTIAINHTHELPEAYKSLERIEASINRLADKMEKQNDALMLKVDKQNEALIRIESNLKK